MTELERARAHLRDSQKELWAVRLFSGYPQRPDLQIYEQRVLDALSWVWEAQCAAGTLVTDPHSSIPTILTTTIDPDTLDTIRIVFAPMNFPFPYA